MCLLYPTVPNARQTSRFHVLRQFLELSSVTAAKHRRLRGVVLSGMNIKSFLQRFTCTEAPDSCGTLRVRAVASALLLSALENNNSAFCLFIDSVVTLQTKAFH